MSRISLDQWLKDMEITDLSPAARVELIEAALRDAPWQLFESESTRRTESGSPNDAAPRFPRDLEYVRPLDAALVDRCARALHRLPEAYIDDFERLVEQTRSLDPWLVLLLGSCSTVLGSAHPVSTPSGGEQWVLEADRTEISHLLRWLESRLDPRAPTPYLYGGKITANSPIDGLGFETQWSADELPVGTEFVLLVLR